MRRIRLAVLGSTNGSSLQTLINAIDQHELIAQIQCVASNKAEAGILARAERHHIPAYYIERMSGEAREDYDRKLFQVLNQYPVDLVVLIGYMRILSKPFIASFPREIINIHPSLLPKHAGLINLAVHQAVLAAGEHESGCTVHFVDEGVDTGEIIMQKHCPVFSKDSAETLKARVQSLEGGALIEAITLLQQQGFHYESRSY